MTEYSQALHVTLWLSVFVSMELLQATDGGNPLHTQTQGSLYWTDYGNGWQFNTHTHNGYLDIQTHTHTCSLLSECGHRWGLCGHRGLLSSEAWRGFRGRQLAVLQAAELSWGSNNEPGQLFWRVSLYPWQQPQRDPHPCRPREARWETKCPGAEKHVRIEGRNSRAWKKDSSK